MKLSPLAAALTLGLGLTLAATGCSAENPSQTPSNIGVSPSSDQNKDPDLRDVTMLRVIDGNTLVVTPVAEDDPRFGEEITMDLVNVKAPSEGECGFQESKKRLTDSFKNGDGAITDISREFAMDYTTADDSAQFADDGHQVANIQWRSGDVRAEMISDGFGTYVEGTNGARENLKTAQDQAKTAHAGLWATCPGFGA